MIKDIVNEMVETYRTNDPYIIAKKANIEVLYRDLGNIKGFFKKIGDRKFIAINEELSEFMEKMVLSHELGHAFLHGDDAIEFKENFINASSYLEKEANTFAAYLLFGYINGEEDVYYINDMEEEKIFRYLKSLLK
ncbi:ImmA/IrrE family metallo-endopeptidase [Streptobacillus felis]|uniref:ImmA/IrrE family metallo-endopeptidase n=1 Tax=Streptobacillus felis TaxID=1384509 RepID=A0A7Z0PF84_9FUSO|nr:ImmA/IrrE family metallo-endopeptidase [Streptobacillus felis]NYV27691.1 ImmA/IrrE family metallo-endopeptidase [Streptobacillus felis]